MKNIDDILKRSKPEVPDLPEEFSKDILLKINELGLEIAPRKTVKSVVNWINLIAGALFLILALLITNTAIFEVQMSGSLELLSFGSRFTADFAGYLPLDMIIPTLVIVAISSWLLWRSHMVKRGIALIAAGSIIVTSVGGTALAATDINRKIQSHIFEKETDIPVISWFFKERAKYHLNHPHFQMGQVTDQKKDHVLITDPYGNTQKIYLPGGMSVQKGQYIRLTGNFSEDGFHGNLMQHCNPSRVGKYFSHREMMKNMMGPKMMMQKGMMNKGMMKRYQMMHDSGKN